MWGQTSTPIDTQRRGPGVKLMDVGRAVSFPVERTWLIERCDQIRMQ